MGDFKGNLYSDIYGPGGWDGGVVRRGSTLPSSAPEWPSGVPLSGGWSGPPPPQPIKFRGTLVATDTGVDGRGWITTTYTYVLEGGATLIVETEGIGIRMPPTYVSNVNLEDDLDKIVDEACDDQ